VQETAQLEAKAYELEQRTAIAHEAKTVLDSWVRYEGQVKQRQQRELAETVIAKIEKELENPKVLKQILDQSVADVESKYLVQRHIFWEANRNRDRLPEGISDQNIISFIKSTPC
jgi:osmotically-inducible protein OsmY